VKLNWAERLMVNNPVRVMIQRRIVKWIGKTVAADPGARVLEVGCGRGAGACLILEKFRPAALHALDLDRRMIRQALAYLSPEQKHHISLYVGDVFRLPYRDGALDGVFGFGVLHHLPDWRGGLREIARVLKPGGFYFLEEFYPQLYQNFLAKRLFLHPEHDRFHSHDLRQALEDCGLSMHRYLEQKQMGILAVVTKEIGGKRVRGEKG
jgi:ubiquinone/menaquinone biosynthesis C-methylase UbiE